MRFERGELQILAAVIEEGGFQRAADKLGLSQSAVSQSVAGLESKLDTVLIRRGRSPVPSQAGRQVYEYALQTLQGEEQLLDELKLLHHGVGPPLSLAMNSYVSQTFAPALFAAMAEQKPALGLNVRVMPSRETIGAVLSAQAEMGFGPFQTRMETFDTVTLTSVEHRLVIGAAHPHYRDILAGDQEQLANCRLIASYLDDVGDRPGQQRIRDFFSHVWQVNSLALRVSLIIRGLGVGFVNEAELNSRQGAASLHAVESVAFARFHREVGLFYRKHRALSSTAEAFVALCRAHFN